MGLLHSSIQVLAWVVALGWMFCALRVLVNLGRVPDLLQPAFAPQSAGREQLPALTVIVPAKDEAAAIEATLRSLLASTYPALQVLAVDDRSTDGTGNIMDRIAAEDNRLRVRHIQELPPGWLGKTHAMALAAREAHSAWLLFTDGDVLFAPDALERAMRFAAATRADHVVVYPTLILKSFGEQMMIGFFQSMTLTRMRLWKIADKKARRDYAGVGAFALVQRPVYLAVGGFDAIRMEVIEDLRLGREIKRAGFAQQLAFGRNLVRVHWASGTLGLARNLTKNAYAAVRFRTELVAVLVGALLLACVAPVAWIFIPSLQWPAYLTFLGMYLLSFRLARKTGYQPIVALAFPMAACIAAAVFLNSAVATLRQGGVVWRGTFYPLAELRRNVGPLF